MSFPKLPLEHIAKALAKNADAALAFGLALVSVLLTLLDVPPIYACGTPLAIFAVYCLRSFHREDSECKKSELEIIKLEKTEGNKLLRSRAAKRDAENKRTSRKRQMK